MDTWCESGEMEGRPRTQPVTDPIPADRRARMVERSRATRQRVRDKAIALMRVMRDGGATNQVIADLTGYSPTTVKRYLR
ncbi:winged helix-turn-helix domain-containing protein [Dyella psychrodurans]|uniref:Winged helix-turn-helix domain-containing protein n=1 Tax=Dyella psychrodurans TaxID=1927960 RepID=A0A370XC35_9GAMM|nr:winged helix-turn-helix domain-containing protein [Dyella psychrodurans]